MTRHCTKSFKYIDSFNAHSISVNKIYYYPHFTNEETEAQTCQKLHGCYEKLIFKVNIFVLFDFLKTMCLYYF